MIGFDSEIGWLLVSLTCEAWDGFDRGGLLSTLAGVDLGIASLFTVASITSSLFSSGCALGSGGGMDSDLGEGNGRVIGSRVDGSVAAPSGRDIASRLLGVSHSTILKATLPNTFCTNDRWSVVVVSCKIGRGSALGLDSCLCAFSLSICACSREVSCEAVELVSFGLVSLGLFRERMSADPYGTSLLGTSRLLNFVRTVKGRVCFGAGRSANG